ncbi:MAG: HAD-IIB family hydrolase [Treponema sp.]|nr:HAD-IIB family hydrolase [Treponema sp.]
MRPILEMTEEEARGIRFVLTDIDDTLTRAGKLHPRSYNALWELRVAGLKVIPVTGRPAGWCDLIAREWPVDGVVGENGALAFWEEAEGNLPALKREFHPRAVKNDHPVLEGIKAKALGEIPGLRVARDQFARLFDLALDFAEEEPVLSLLAAEQVRRMAEEAGAKARVSSIHVNIWMGNYDKLSMAEYFLTRRFGWKPGIEDAQVIFVGDSPNDEPMFARFPLTCGVANIRRYQGLLKTFPGFTASREYGEGFAEIAAIILEKRDTRPVPRSYRGRAPRPRGR